MWPGQIGLCWHAPSVGMLPKLSESDLVRADFTDSTAWEHAAAPCSRRRLRVEGRKDENRHRPGGLLLVFGVVRPGCGGPLEPGRVLLAVDLPGLVVLLDRAVLKLHVRVRGQVVVPDGVLGRATQRRDDGVLAIVLDAHQRRLAQLPGLGAHRGQHDHRPALVVGALGTASAFVDLDLTAAEVEGARLVLSRERHVFTIQSVDSPGCYSTLPHYQRFKRTLPRLVFLTRSGTAQAPPTRWTRSCQARAIRSSFPAGSVRSEAER